MPSLAPQTSLSLSLGKGPAGEVFGVEEQFRFAVAVGQVLYADVLEVDGHGWPGVELHCEQALHHAALGVVVDEFHGLEAVEVVKRRDCRGR